MKRRTFVAGLAAGGTSLAAANRVFAQSNAETILISEGDEMAESAPQIGYAPVNGLQMYYEIHGHGGVPLVLLHGAYMAIGGFGPFLPALAKTRQVIAVELQGHGHTADIDRPLKYELMADDVAALMDQVGVAQADMFGYSMGGGVALQLAMRHPGVVRKQVVASALYRLDGMYPEVISTNATITPEMMMSTPWYEEYARVAPNPGDFPTLVDKLKRLDAEDFAWSEGEIRAIAAPTLLVMGDADVIRPEHTLALFRLLGGGVPGDLTGLPQARLAVLPGTTHITVMNRADWLMPMIVEFLDAPMPEVT